MRRIFLCPCHRWDSISEELREYSLDVNSVKKPDFEGCEQNY